jgi:hypothetical protein
MFYSSVELQKETMLKYRESLYTIKKSTKISFSWALMFIFAAANQNKLALSPFWYESVGEHPHSGFPPSAHAASGIPPKLNQSDNSDHTKRQFELVMRLGQSSISNYAVCRVRGLLCVK